MSDIKMGMMTLINQIVPGTSAKSLRIFFSRKILFLLYIQWKQAIIRIEGILIE